MGMVGKLWLAPAVGGPLLAPVGLLGPAGVVAVPLTGCEEAGEVGFWPGDVLASLLGDVGLTLEGVVGLVAGDEPSFCDLLLLLLFLSDEEEEDEEEEDDESLLLLEEDDEDSLLLFDEESLLLLLLLLEDEEPDSDFELLELESEPELLELEELLDSLEDCPFLP